MVQEEVRPPRPSVTLVVDIGSGLFVAWAATLPWEPGWLTSLFAIVAAAFLVAGIGLFGRVFWIAWFAEAASGVVVLFGAFSIYQVTQCQELECLGAPIVAFISVILMAAGVGIGIANHIAHRSPRGVAERREDGQGAVTGL